MNQPVFIVGCDRSGTTLLSLLLSQSPDLHMTLESGFIPKLYDKKENYGNFSKPKQRQLFIRDLQSTNATSKTIAFDIFEMSIGEAEETIKHAAPTDYAGAIDALFHKTAQKNSKQRWGNKTPKYVHQIDLLVELFPNAKIIHIIRDPRDVASSIMKTGWVPTLKDAAVFWKERVSEGLKGRSLGKEVYYEMKYESLLEQPVSELKKVCKWLEIVFEDNSLNNYKDDRKRIPDEHENLFDLIGKPIDKSRAFAWKRNMSKADAAEIEDINVTLIQKLNYEITNYKIPLRRKLFRKTYDFLKSLKRSLT